MRWLRVLCIVACAVMPVLGTTVTGAFAGTPCPGPICGDLGPTHTYIFGSGSGFSILASGFTSGGSTVHLFGKTLGGDETGLGLTNDPSSPSQREITVGSFIQLDLSNLPHDISGHILPGLSITMGSTTSPDAYRISQSSTSGTLGGCITTTCWSGTSSGSKLITPTPILPTLKYLDITATAGNVLLISISFDDPGGGGQATPEPLSFALVGGGLIGMYFIRRRRPGPR